VRDRWYAQASSRAARRLDRGDGSAAPGYELVFMAEKLVPHLPGGSNVRHEWQGPLPTALL
jgi:hypothetical protein